jgi:hypothetical protein
LAARESPNWTLLFIESPLAATIESLTSFLFPERIPALPSHLGIMPPVESVVGDASAGGHE